MVVMPVGKGTKLPTSNDVQCCLERYQLKVANIIPTSTFKFYPGLCQNSVKK